MFRLLPPLTFTFLAAALVGPAPTAVADTNDYLLIKNELGTQRVRLVEIRDETLVHLQDGLWVTVDLNECIAILDTSAKPTYAAEGMVVLNDGQQFPGEPISDFDTSEDELSWRHRWLGRIDVPLDEIRTVLFRPGAQVPAKGDGETLLLSNGDRFSGFIISLNDPVVIEVDREGGRELLEVPRSNVAAARMAAVPISSSGQRVWFDDGTAIDVESISVSDDGFVRLTTAKYATGTTPALIKLEDLDALLLDSDRLRSLASLPPDRVEGPPTRHRLPQPEVLVPNASLELSPIEFRGPLVARYILPGNCRRFATEAAIPRDSHQWADFELIIRSDDEEVFRAHMYADNPTATINVPLSGTELTIELTEGRHGPIQDRLILEYPLLLLGD